MKHLGLFEGIGGFSLAARWMGWKTLAWCEIDPFCQKVLKHHFPHAQGFIDIKETDFKKYANRIDIVTGGFPCQPYSTAGNRAGKEDVRHLWPEMLRAIKQIKPSWVIGENVRGLVSWNGGLVFDEVQSDLESEGYEVFPVLLPACGLNAPHRRERIWFIAYSNENGRCRASARANETESETSGLQQQQYEVEFTNTASGGRVQNNKKLSSIEPEHASSLADPNNAGHSIRFQTEFGSVHGKAETSARRKFTRKHTTGYWSEFPTQSPVCTGNDGLSGKLDGITFPKWRSESIKSAGNAVVPQIPFEIFKAIEKYGASNPPQ